MRLQASHLSPSPLSKDSLYSVVQHSKDMGQILEKFQVLQQSKAVGQILEKIQGKEWRQKQLRKITDSVYDRFTNETGSANLTFEDLYISVLFVYNDINKRLPGAHLDPPSKAQVRTMMQDCDVNLDGVLDREEFVKFILQLTKDTFITASQRLLVTLLVTPIVALVTKRATEGIPGFGGVVHRLPNSVHASLVTLAAVMFQNSGQAIN